MANLSSLVLETIFEYQSNENAPVTGQKGESQNWFCKKQGTPNFLKTENFLPPDKEIFGFQKIWRAFFLATRESDSIKENMSKYKHL